jgi:hypothetical protein
MTIHDLLRGQNTIRQLDILSRADRMFADRFADRQGRYYGGILTPEQIRILDPEQSSERAQSAS